LDFNFWFFQVEGFGYFNLVDIKSELMRLLNVLIFDGDDTSC
jgi:hypothetical protein